jgi:hypothetical protein
VLLAAVNVPLTVVEPVLVNVVTVVEPAFIVPVVFTLKVPDKSAVLIELSTICALLTVFAPTVDGTFVNCDPSPINPAAVTVPFAKILSRKRTVVVPWVVILADIVPTDKNPPVIVPRFDTVILAAVIEPFSSTTKVLFAAVSVPVDAIEEAVTEPVALIVEAVIEPALSTLKTFPVIAKVEAVTEPVDVIVVAVIEPALSTLKLPALTVNEPIFNVVSVMLSVFAMSLPVIELSTIVELATESVPTVVGTFVNCYPSPINPVAVTVPMTCSVVAGVVVPMPILLSFLTYKVDVPEVFTTCSDASVFAEDEPAM